MNGRRRLIGSFSHGSMANGLPQGIGAQASHPGRQVVTLSGDGGIAMLLGEQITLRQQHLPPKLTYGEIKGFTLYATRTLLSGEGTQLVDLVRTNLREVEAE
jgi:TPP-dependent 2-oxoacid decarboxylase